MWEVESREGWQWDEVNDYFRADPAKFRLTEGVHTIKIKLREAGAELDTLLLIDDLGFIPRNR
jgi:hypothetical protein